MKFFNLPVLTNLSLKMATTIEIKVRQLTNHEEILHVLRLSKQNSIKKQIRLRKLMQPYLLVNAAVSVSRCSRKCE